MYATEKYVKMEVKELRQQLSDIVTDLGGDIRYLDQEISELKSLLQAIQEELIRARENES
jgi:hypothetical protein